ncbi:FadR/GntR family transcriptional regulator [Agrococcus sp. HG114]|uniref:FadR/GntR family transcriptional regulator n=1 Tax=Agrococcus sp. HG114 TaxID=2969757 RepID=UPI00215B4B16|nr:FCD domain-containing protein [Agrococcus sp. HG114]MCR8669731.1 FCD domain-containing protein [Agrococcus sp. HG114]
MPRPSRTHDAVDSLLDAIIEGRLTAGEQLPPEGQLAAELGISRLTMREAVRLLQAQGVIVQVPGSRHLIAPVSEWTGMDAVVRHARSAGQRRRSSLELLEVRMMIETGAAQLAAERRSDEHLAAMAEALGAMRAHHERADVDAFVCADLEFHDIVMRAADNRILVAALRPLTSMLADTRGETSAVAEIREHAIAEHAAVLEAIRSGVPEAARDAMASHMRQTRDDLVTLVGP